MKKNRLQALKERLKRLCVEYDIPKHQEKAPKLWNDLTQVMTARRHFFAHSNPEALNAIMQKLMEAKPSFAYDTAVAIIRHFFDKQKKPRPDWLETWSLVVPEVRVAPPLAFVRLQDNNRHQQSESQAPVSPIEGLMETVGQIVRPDGIPREAPIPGMTQGYRLQATTKGPNPGCGVLFRVFGPTPNRCLIPMTFGVALTEPPSAELWRELHELAGGEAVTDPEEPPAVPWVGLVEGPGLINDRTTAKELTNFASHLAFALRRAQAELA